MIGDDLVIVIVMFMLHNFWLKSKGLKLSSGWSFLKLSCYSRCILYFLAPWDSNKWLSTKLLLRFVDS